MVWVFAVVSVRVWWFVGARFVGFLLALLPLLTSKLITTTDNAEVDVHLQKLPPALPAFIFEDASLLGWCLIYYYDY